VVGEGDVLSPRRRDESPDASSRGFQTGNTYNSGAAFNNEQAFYFNNNQYNFDKRPTFMDRQKLYSDDGKGDDMMSQHQIISYPEEVSCCNCDCHKRKREYYETNS